MIMIRDKKTIIFQLREEAWLILKGKEVYSVISYQSSVCATFLYDLTSLLRLSLDLGSFLTDEAGSTIG